MAASCYHDGLSALRTQIELNVPNPALIVLTSAKADDGCILSAITVCDSLATAGHRVSLLVTDNDDLAALDHTKFPVSLLSTELSAGRPVDAIAEFAVTTRREYDFTVVAAQPLGGDVASVLLANCANAVFISVRIGRLRCPEDASLIQALKRTEARVLGVIGASEASISSFDRGAVHSAPLGERKPRTQTAAKTNPSTATAK